MVYIPKKGTVAWLWWGWWATPIVNQTNEEEEKKQSKASELLDSIWLWLTNTYTPWTGNASTLPEDTVIKDTLTANSYLNWFGAFNIYSDIAWNNQENIKKGIENMKTNIGSWWQWVWTWDAEYIKSLIGDYWTWLTNAETINLMTNSLETKEAKEEEEKEAAMDKMSLLKWLNPAYPFTIVTNLEIDHIIKPTINYIGWLFKDDNVAALETKSVIKQQSLHWNSLTDEDKRDYLNMLNELIALEEYVNNWQVTKEQYSEAVNEVADKYKDQFSIYSSFASTKKEDIDTSIAVDYVKADIESIKDTYKYQQTINEIDPDYANKKSYEQLLQQKSISKVMTDFTVWLWYAPSTLDKKSLSNKAYASVADQVWRWNNSMASARITLNKLMALCDWDPSKLEWENKEIYNEILRLSAVYDKFEENLWKLYKVIPTLADPETWEIVMPDTIAWKSLHEWLFDWMEPLLTDADYWYNVLWKNSVSTIDVLENMSARITYKYSEANRSILNPARAWTSLQYYWWRVVWWNLTETLWHQTLWRAWASIYNTAAKKSWELSFSYMDQDFTMLSTMNTNKSRAWWLIQKYNAQVAERWPEILEAVWELWVWNAWLDALNASKFSRVLANKWPIKFFSEAWKYAGTAEELAAWAQKWNNITKSLSVWDKIRKYGSNISNYTKDLSSAKWVAKLNIWGKIVEVWLEDLTAAQRLASYLLIEVPREVLIDQLWDARFANADTELGSDTSMIFSLWGTALWTLLPKLVKSWLFWIWNWTIDLVNKSIDDVLDWWLIQKSWWDWNSFDLVKLIDKDSMPVFDALAKTKFWLNSSRLAYWEELASFSGILWDVSKALEIAMKDVRWLWKVDLLTWYSQDMKKFIALQMSNVFWANSQISNRVWQLVADERTNPADIFKYVLQLRWTMQLWWRRSSIRLADDSVPRFVRQYDETLDFLPSFTNWWFWRALNEWFTTQELIELKKAWYSWADVSNFKRNKDWRFNFTKDWLEKAWWDIVSQSMDTPLLAKITDNAQDFDVLMRWSNVKKVSDETLDMIRDTWTYDVLAEALWRMPAICWLKKI